MFHSMAYQTGLRYKISWKRRSINVIVCSLAQPQRDTCTTFIVKLRPIRIDNRTEPVGTSIKTNPLKLYYHPVGIARAGTRNVVQNWNHVAASSQAQTLSLTRGPGAGPKNRCVPKKKNTHTHMKVMCTHLWPTTNNRCCWPLFAHTKCHTARGGCRP